MQAFEELERLLGEEGICLAVKAKLTKDSGVAGASAYEHIVEKLQAKPNATGEQASPVRKRHPIISHTQMDLPSSPHARMSACILYLQFAVCTSNPQLPMHPSASVLSHSAIRSSALHCRERGANPIFTLDSHLISYHY